MNEDSVTEADEKPVESSTTPESVTEENTQETDSATEKTEEDKKPNRVQERINQLTREKYEAKQQAKELEERLKALESAKPTETTETVAPKEEDFENYSDFQNAHAKYVAEIASEKAYTKLSEENERRTLQEEENDRKQVLAAKKKSFEDNLAGKRDNFQDFESIAYGHEFMDLDLAEQIFDLDKGPEVAYYLGSHLDEAERLFSLNAVQRARELTKLEFRVDELDPKKVSDAPDPITPLGNSEVVESDPDKMTADEWQAWRNKQVHG